MSAGEVERLVAAGPDAGLYRIDPADLARRFVTSVRDQIAGPAVPR